MSVKKRLKQFIESQDMPVKAFEESIKASNGYVNSISRSIGLDKLTLIIENYPNLNLEWLLTGDGEMIKKKNNPRSIYSSLFEQERSLHELIRVNNQSHKLYEDKIELLENMNELRIEKIAFLESEIEKLKKELSSTSHHRNVDEPDS